MLLSTSYGRQNCSQCAKWLHACFSCYFPMYLCNIPNFQFGMLYIGHHTHIIFYLHFVCDPRNSKQLKDPRRELGISFIFIFEFVSNIEKRITLVLIIFLSEIFHYKNKREEIIWLLQNKRNIRGKMLKIK